MAKNKRKTYGENETGGEEADVKPCAECGCRHFDPYRKDYATGKVLQRICRNCGTVFPAS